MHGLALGPGDDADSLDWLRHVPTWKADVLPLDEPWRGSAPARAMLVVMGEGDVVEDELLDASACASASDVARLLGEAVHEVARQAGGYPRRLRVRDGGVAGLLAAELDAHGVDVRVSAMRETERAIRELAALLDEPEVARDLGPVDGWSGLAAEDSAVFVAAAARFWRARPWERLDEREALLARWRGRDSAVVVTPPLGHGHVITVFTHAPDYRDPFGQPEHPVWGVKLTRRERLPRMLRREVEPSLWTVADDGTCCMVLEDAADALPAGDSLRYLAAMLSAVAALAESRAPARRGLCFHDGESGVELRLERDVHRTPWPAMKRARPACAPGPAADPEAALRPARLGAVERG
ncbi:MAG TPA: hypothetical protein VHG91_11430, partial [Longimicrobium sp.]|nr:hypothetical protein [Longimicrobium sp.]